MKTCKQKEIFSKDDLVYRASYQWIPVEEKNHQFKGDPNSTKFNKYDGYQMLYIVNKILDHCSVKTTKLGKYIEVLIYIQLPPDINNQRQVYFWSLNKLRKEADYLVN